MQGGCRDQSQEPAPLHPAQSSSEEMLHVYMLITLCNLGMGQFFPHVFVLLFLFHLILFITLGLICYVNFQTLRENMLPMRQPFRPTRNILLTTSSSFLSSLEDICKPQYLPPHTHYCANSQWSLKRTFRAFQ